MWITFCALLNSALRDRISLFWSVLAPLALLFGLGSLFPHPEYRRNLILGLLAFGCLGFALSGTGFEVMRQRTRGVYKMLAGAVVVLGVGAAVYGVDGTLWSLALFLPVLILGIACFMFLGFVLGNLGENENQVALYNNLFILPQIFASEIFYTLDNTPAWVTAASRLMPASHFVNALRAAAALDGDAFVVSVAMLLGMTLLALFLAVVTFRWNPERR